MAFWPATDILIYVEKTDEGPLLVGKDNKVLEWKEASELINQIINTYSKENINEQIDLYNQVQRLLNSGFDFRRAGRYYRFNDKVYEQKEFRTNLQRDWSFKCSWCGKKVSSKTEVEYYSMVLESSRFAPDFKRTCSEACVQLLWDEWLKNWLKENNLDTPKILKMAGYNP